MRRENLIQRLRFYFITDDDASIPPVDQVKAAIKGGASMIQYRNKSGSIKRYEEAVEIRRICRRNSVLFIINDDILLAKAVEADGVHVGQEDDNPSEVRRIMGEESIIGISVSRPTDLSGPGLKYCDYVGAGPVFATSTKKDASPAMGCEGLKEICSLSPLPVVAVGGITPENARLCLENGASGVCMISSISRADDPEKAALNFSSVLGIESNPSFFYSDENSLLKDVLGKAKGHPDYLHFMKVAPGDDSCLLKSLERPVISTDSHVENVHFRRSWQSLAEIGKKAVTVCLSDLAASYARPVAIFINLGLPEGFSGSETLELYHGIQSALEEYGGCIGGGNISRNRQLSLELFAIGEGGSLFPVRSSAKPGFGLYSTGFLGLSRCGLMLNSISSLYETNKERWTSLDLAFRNPKARFDAASILEKHGVDCLMDISDGLAADSFRLAEASGITIELFPELIPIHHEMKSFCAELSLDPIMEAAEGGEDYELLFACDQSLFEEIRKETPSAFMVGICREFNGSRLLNLPSGISSFDHLSEKNDADINKNRFF